MAESVIFIREQGIKSVKQLDEFIQKAANERQNLQNKIKSIDKGNGAVIRYDGASSYCQKISCLLQGI